MGESEFEDLGPNSGLAEDMYGRYVEDPASVPDGWREFFDNREANPNPWTKEVWYYDYRTNVHHTLKKKTMRFEDLAEFIKCYNTANRRGRKETWHATKNPEGRWRRFAYDNLKARDKTSLDVFWLKDKSLTDLDNLPEPEDLAEEIIENLEAGLNSFKEVLAGLNKVA